MPRGVERTLVAFAPNDPGTVVRRWPGVETVSGGVDRASSVLALLDALADQPATSWVLVHDAECPCVALAGVQRLLQAVRESDADGGTPASPVRGTIRRVDEARRRGGERRYLGDGTGRSPGVGGGGPG
ncbi:MAG: 2-C-methyl-D-erythritol 4-phosphate cytidylyltransferase [Pseudomonadota bacterium]